MVVAFQEFPNVVFIGQSFKKDQLSWLHLEPLLLCIVITI